MKHQHIRIMAARHSALIWGGLGMNMKEFDKRAALLDDLFDFAREADRAKIRGLNAIRLFGFEA